MVVKVTQMFPSLQSPSFHPLSSALSLSVPPVAIRTCPRTLDICPDRPLPTLDSPDITMKMCTNGRETSTNGPVGPWRRFLGQVHKIPTTGAVVTGAVVTGAVVTGAGEPVPIFQRLASPIFQIADFSEARIADLGESRCRPKKNPFQKNKRANYARIPARF